jgi:FMN reductase
MSGRTLAVVTAGLSQPSSTRLLADRLAAATRGELGRLGVPVDTTVVDLRDHAHDLVNNMLTGFPSPDLKRAVDAVSHADGLIAVTPVFKASYNGLFKSFFDVLDDRALVDKPVLIAATGGTARHSLALEHALRPLFAYLRALVVPTSVYAATDDWAGAAVQGALAERIDRAARELARQMEQRPPTTVADPFALSVPFAQLLAGVEAREAP